MNRLVVVAMFLVSGCATTRTIDAVKMLAERPPVAAGPAEAGAQPVKVVLDFGPALGAAVLDKDPLETGELHSVAGEEEVDAEKDRMRAEGKEIAGGVYVPGAADAFATVLGHHLGTRLPGSTVVVGGDGDLRITAKGTWMVYDGTACTMSLILTVTPKGEQPFTIEGAGAGALVSMAHLAWIVPLSLLVPPGPILAVVGMRSLWGSAHKMAVPTSLDVAAVNATDAIVRWRKGEPPIAPPTVAAALSTDASDWGALDAGLRVGLDSKDELFARIGPPQTTINGSYGTCNATQMFLWQRSSQGASEGLAIIFDANDKVCIHKLNRQ